MKLNKYGYGKHYKNLTPKILFCKEVLLINNFINRKVYVAYDLYKDKVLNQWYIDKYLENFTIRKLFSFKGIYLNPLSNNIFRKIYSKLFRTKKIYLKNTDILLLGPYSHNHFHILNDFILRLFFLIKNNKVKRVFIPKSCEKYVKELKLNKFFKFKLKYLNNNYNYQFFNANYLTHFENRSNNYAYRMILKQFKSYLGIKKKSGYKNIFILRKTKTRRILNEKKLSAKLKKSHFNSFDFEKMSISSQLKNSNDAKIIVGYHGSGLVNAILFGNKNLKLIEIFNKYYQNPVFEVMAKNANIKYRKFVCKKSFLNLDCVVNENHFLKYLNL